MIAELPSLQGRRVLVTRAVEDAGAWAFRLAALGADPVILPCIRTELFDDDNTRNRLAAALREASWLCVTSPRGAEAVSRLASPLPPQLRVAAVGEATAAAVSSRLGREAFVAKGGTSLALGQELLPELGAARPARVVVAVAEGGRTDAEDVLARGGAIVMRIAVYRTLPAAQSESPMNLAQERINDVLLASPSAVLGLINQTSMPQRTRLYTIGPTTSAAVVAAGLPVTGEAARPDFDSLVEAMQ